jgi:predicted MFS family arabinose efflux permease
MNVSLQDGFAATDSRQGRWALLATCLGVLIVLLGTTVVTVALPSIRQDMHLTDDSLVWVLNSYLLAFAGSLLLSGRLADVYGQRRVFLIGIALFTVASAVCGIASSFSIFLAARAMQGLGAAAVMAVALSLIITIFTEESERAKAMGVYGFISTIGGSLGLLLGGLLTSLLSWPWVFLINVPLCALVFLMSSVLLPATPDCLMVASPPVHLSTFCRRNLAIANAIGVLWAGGIAAWSFITSLYLQLVLGYGPMQIGLAFLPANVLVAAFSLGISARLVLRFGIRGPLCIGMVLAAIGLLLLAQISNREVSVTDLGLGMVCLGVGAGVVVNPLLLSSMSDVPETAAGLASGISNTARMVGSVLGVAILGSVSAGRAAESVAAGVLAPLALADGYRLAFLVATGFMGMGAAMGATLLKDIDPREKT